MLYALVVVAQRGKKTPSNLIILRPGQRTYLLFTSAKQFYDYSVHVFRLLLFVVLTEVQVPVTF